MFNKMVVAALPLIPRPILRRVSMRYIAGDHLQDAIDTVKTLAAAEGARGTIDVLGEFVTSRDQSLIEMQHCRAVLEAIVAQDLVGTAGLSIKPTSLGLGIDFGFAYAHIRELALMARDRGIFMRIDMENSPYTDDTLKAYRMLRDEGIHNVGIVIQAMMRRSARDVEELAGYKPDIRLCKGIYRESEEVAFQGREEVRASYKALLRQIVDGGMRVAIATHDDPLIDDAFALIAERGLGPEDYEFQMLLGVREPKRREVLAAGHVMRVYVPFGEDWYGYASRRLKENPEMAGMIAKAVLLGQ